MKIATNRYAVKITKDGKTSWDGYYGYKTRKEAEIRAGLWEKIGFKAEIIDSKKEAKIAE